MRGLSSRAAREGEELAGVVGSDCINCEIGSCKVGDPWQLVFLKIVLNSVNFDLSSVRHVKRRYFRLEIQLK